MQTETSQEKIITNLKSEINDNIIILKEKSKTESKATDEIQLICKKLGKKLIQLSALDLVTYRELLEEYKPLSKTIFTEARKGDRRILEERRKAELQIMNMSTRGMSGDSAGYDNTPSKFVERTRGESAERVKKPLPPNKKEKTVAKFEKIEQSTFEFNGNTYGKGPLVLAVVKEHAALNKGITHEQMKAAFPDSLLRGYGIFTTQVKADELCKTRKRYFVKADQLVKLSDETIAICNQFTSDNIGAFLNQAKLLGYTIK